MQPFAAVTVSGVASVNSTTADITFSGPITLSGYPPNAGFTINGLGPTTVTLQSANVARVVNASWGSSFGAPWSAGTSINWLLNPHTALQTGTLT